MIEHYRPDPESLLASIKKDEEESSKGKLKVFFGMSAGVGKTYAMLKAAHKLKDDGADVVAGYVETHRRAETDELVKGLEVIPRISIDHHGLTVEEFNIDDVLERKPEVVLVDELAHSNAAGSRHNKRYQDVIELLDHGINVYTTLNVQHLESQADVVEQITGVKIREILPDSILDRADSIELIDISPEGLLKRLSEGKVYIPEKAEIAAERFFRKGNITALREMALNYVAKSVDSDLQHYMQRKNIPGPWKAGDRLMVAVSPSPYSEYLIRWTRRMAFNLKASWIALYIEKRKTLTESDQCILKKNLNLARELGAEVLSTIDDDIVAGLMRVARQKNITQIVIGKPLRIYLSDFFTGGNLVERLLKASGDIEVHIVNQPSVTPQKFRFSNRLSFTGKPYEYISALISVSVITLVNLLIANYTGYWAIALMYLIFILLLGLYVGRGAIFIAAAVSSLAWNFLFIPPLFTLRIAKLEDLMMFFAYFISAMIVGGLTSKLHSKEWALRIREKTISDIYEFSKVLENASDIDEIVITTVKYIEQYFHVKTAFILRNSSGGLSDTQHKYSSFIMHEGGRGIAEWVFKNRKSAGLNTDTLPQASASYIPLNSPGRVMGVLCIQSEKGSEFSFDQDNFFNSIVYQVSMKLERVMLSIESKNSFLLAESERIYKILLNSISHELRTPLTTITGASTSLLDNVVESKPEIRNALIREIYRASGRLNRLVDNLLDMSRLESGMMKLNKQKQDMGDLVSVVLRTLEEELSEYKVLIDIPDSLPMVNIDFVLMEQALINLVYNAVNHTPSGTVITISIQLSENSFQISVKDNGPGLIPEEIPFLFDKFQRGAASFSGGTGLGLSICKGIVDAHNGYVSAENNADGGAKFTITLPVETWN